MERGTPDQTVYTFEVADGQTLQYPDGELWTRNYQEADSHARKMGYMLIANNYEWEDTELVEDYTPAPPSPACASCGIDVSESDTGFWEDPDYPASSDNARYCDESPDHLHHPDGS
jgi:hypothetical protein